MEQHKKIIATLCYIVDKENVLLVHRNKKDNDTHVGKYNGLGGKSEPGEDPHACVVREIKEETGLDISPTYRGNMTYGGFGKNGEDWEVHIFRASTYSGNLIDCPEGTLEWCGIADFLAGKYPIWESDKLFLDHVFQTQGVFVGQATYERGTYVNGSVELYKI